MAANFDVTAARKQFPALQQDHQVFFDNAGGSQVLSTVATSVKDYLEETNVQLGASYNVSKRSTEVQGKGLEAAAEFMGADPDEVVIGPSTTQLFANLSQILPPFPPNSEIILSHLDHEANLASWVRLAAHNPNITIKWWPATPTSSPPETSPLLTPTTLQPFLTPNTKLLALTHTSNILGSIHDIRALATTLHTACPGAFITVDGVALAPHRPLDVHALGVDFYAFSWYKCYGPHISILYASRAAQARLGTLGHYFHPTTTLGYKLGLAGSSYELVAALPKIVEYFGGTGKERREGTWAGIAAHEVELQETLLRYLRSRAEKGEVTIWGSADGRDAAMRVPVVSFTMRGRSSREVVEAVEQRSGSGIGGGIGGGGGGGRQFGIRWGHFYSKRLVDEYLGLGACDGVVRVSMVHYNTVEEVEAFVGVLDEVLRGFGMHE